MFNSIRSNPPQQIPKQKDKEDCKIKIRKSSQGKTIEFSGNCSKDQISIAKENIKDDIWNE